MVEVDEQYAQEEEWEREGLLDPAWEKQQRKVMLELGISNIYFTVCIKCLGFIEKTFSV